MAALEEEVEVPCTPNGEFSYRFAEDDPRWLQFLDEEGYVVLKSVVSEDDVATAKGYIWDDLECGYVGVSRDDPGTWVQSSWRLPISGLCASLAQTKGPWHLRGLPGVRNAFRQIWGTDDLITSMDSVICWRPWWTGAMPEGERWLPRTEGLHLDQNPWSKPKKDCIQGMLPLIDVTEEVGGLQVVPRSHTDEAKVGFKLRHPEMEGIGDWCMLKPWDADGKNTMLLCAKAGDLILWDSRTIHGGVVRNGKTATATAEEAPDLARMTCTVAMTPRAWASEEVQQARREGQAAGLSFNHCPHEAGESTGTIHAKRREGFQEYELSEAQLAVL